MNIHVHEKCASVLKPFVTHNSCLSAARLERTAITCIYRGRIVRTAIITLHVYLEFVGETGPVHRHDGLDFFRVSLGVRSVHVQVGSVTVAVIVCGRGFTATISG